MYIVLRKESIKTVKTIIYKRAFYHQVIIYTLTDNFHTMKNQKRKSYLMYKGG